MPCYNTAPHKRLHRVLFRPCSYTANATKQRAGLYRGVSCNLPHSIAADTIPAQAAIIPPATRWSTSQRRRTSSACRIPTQRRTLHRSTQPPYYNKVYKGAPLLWIHARRCSISQTMPARRGSRYFPRPAACDLAPSTRRVSPAVGSRGGRRGTIGGLRRSSFRAFAR